MGLSVVVENLEICLPGTRRIKAVFEAWRPAQAATDEDARLVIEFMRTRQTP